MPPNTFRIGYRNIFLTYAQSSFENGNLVAYLFEKLEPYDPVYIVVSKEFHKYPEGHELAGQENPDEPHHHALIQLKKKPSIRNARYFDYNGRHPSIEKAPKEINGNAVATLSDTRQYVIKDGVFVEEGEFDPNNAVLGRKRNNDAVYAEALACQTEEEFTEKLQSEAPRDFIIFNDKITSFAKRRFKPTIPAYQSERTIDDFILPAAVSDWYTSDFMVRGFHTRTLLLTLINPQYSIQDLNVPATSFSSVNPVTAKPNSLGVWDLISTQREPVVPIGEVNAEKSMPMPTTTWSSTTGL